MNESRVPAGNFGASSIPWTNLQGDQIEDREKTTLPEGWKWTDDWTIDLNRACDEEGKNSFNMSCLPLIKFFSCKSKS